MRTRHFFRFLLLIFPFYTYAQYVRTEHHQFTLNGKPYQYVGANYWYGGFLAYDTANNGKLRLAKELDFLAKNGVTQLRIIAAVEGDSSYPFRIYPSLQPQPKQYNETLLCSFDYFLNEAAKRKMKIVMVLNNNWEWSGGFGQYLEWAGEKDIILPKTSSWDWDKYCQFIAKFYTCDSCQIWYRAWIKHIVLRKNTINGKIYYQDPTIMSWELANEPRPMRKEVLPQYQNWIKEISTYIKSLDKNHLVTTGVEGYIGTSMDSSAFMYIHRLATIDYATIHLWPKTWQWYSGIDAASTSDTTLAKSSLYIQTHSRWMKKIKKPLVVEEFGHHRNGHSFIDTSLTTYRDIFYQHIFRVGRANNIAGYNFWGAVAFRDKRLTSDFWRQGLPYTADPPQEEQGLYGIYLTDTSTWNIIRQINQELK